MGAALRVLLRCLDFFNRRVLFPWRERRVVEARDPIRHLNFIALLEKRLGQRPRGGDVGGSGQEAAGAVDHAACTADHAGWVADPAGRTTAEAGGMADEAGDPVEKARSFHPADAMCGDNRQAGGRNRGSRGQVTERQVLEANRALFERHVGPFRELHRGVLEGEEPYLEKTLTMLGSMLTAGAVLDAGCGDGRITSRARRHFSDMTGIDLSLPLLREVPSGSKRACGDVQTLPFRSGVFSLILCHYTLHHLYAVDKFVREAYRVLVPGGVLFIDHEMDAGFRKRFRGLVGLHDFFFGLDRRYRRLDPAIAAEDVRMAEYHYFQKKGILPAGLERELRAAGFLEISIRHHGFGVNRFLNRLLSRLRLWSMPALFSPHFSVTAKKP